MNNTYRFAKSVALVDYMDPFRQNQDNYTWGWESISTKKSTNRATEQVFSFGGLPAAMQTGELQPIFYADMSEQAATTFTVNKFTLATMFSYEFLKDAYHLPDMMSEAGTAAGESHSFIKDQAMAAPLNRAFNSSYTMYDDVELCGTHTLDSGDSYVNKLTTASISYDNVWLGVNHFETTPLSQSGLYITDTPEYILYHPSKHKEVRAILESDKEPGTADNDKNTLKDYNLKPLPCRHLSTTTNWFIVGSKFKKDFLCIERETPQTATDDDFDRMGMKFRSHQRFAVGIRDFFWIVGNVGV